MTSSALLARARFLPPRRRGDALRRQPLLDRMSEAIDAAALLLVAPAGFGKTTLAVEWLREVALPSAWLSLEAEHRDPGTLLRDLVAALAPLVPEVERLRVRLEVGGVPGSVRPLVHELLAAVETADDPALLVLADVHVLEAESLAVLDGIIAAGPSSLRLVLLSRVRPALASLPRATTTGEVVLLDAADLAFSEPEAHEFLRHSGVERERDRAAIIARAGGWPAALAVLARRYDSAARRVGPRARIELDEFIRVEVMGLLSAEERALLEACSVVSYLDPDLAATLSGQTRAPSMLRDLELTTQLLSTVEDGPALRMHSLLREHCMARLQRESPERLESLRRSAARALRERGEQREALVLALDAEDWDFALEVASGLADQLYERGEWRSLTTWLDRLPHEVLLREPRLYLLRARVATRQMRPQETLLLLDQLPEAALQGADGGRAALYQATALRQTRAFDDALATYRRARTLIDEHEPDDSPLRVELDLEEGVAFAMSGQFDTALRTLSRAASAAETAGSPRLSAEAFQNLGTAFLFAGDLVQAMEAFRSARRRLELIADPEALLATLNNAATAQHLLGEVDAAERSFGEIVERADALQLERLAALGRMGLADIARDRGDLEVAAAGYADVLERAQALDHGGLELAAALGLALANREQGNLARARALLEHYLRTAEDQGAAELATRLRAGLGATLISEGNLARAVEVLQRAVETGGRAFQLRQSALSLFLLAVARFRLGEGSAARATLEELHPLIESLGYDQFLIAEARQSLDLLTDPDVTSIAGGYFARLASRAPARNAPTAEVRDASTEVDFIVRAFGTPTVRRPQDSEADLPWRSERSKELLLFLLDASRPVTREEIEAALWPETEASRLTSLFHSTLHRTRRAMGSEAVAHGRDGYSLSPSLRVDYDVRRFLDMLAEAEHAEDGARARELQARAIELRTGLFARGIESPWAVATRARLDDAFIAAALALARHEVTTSQYTRAIAHAEAVLEVDELNEEAVRHLIAARVGNGQPDLAMRAYRRLQQLLADELDAVPSRETVLALERAVASRLARN